MALHDQIHQLVSTMGPRVLSDSDELRAALDDYLAEGTASTGEINLLVDAVRLGAFDQLQRAVAEEAAPSAAIEQAGEKLAYARGSADRDGASWACAVLAYAAGLVSEAEALRYRAGMQRAWGSASDESETLPRPPLPPDVQQTPPPPSSPTEPVYAAVSPPGPPSHHVAPERDEGPRPASSRSRWPVWLLVVALLAVAIGAGGLWWALAGDRSGALPSSREVPRYDGVVGNFEASRAFISFLEDHDGEPVQLDEVGFNEATFDDFIGNPGDVSYVQVWTECDPPIPDDVDPDTGIGCMATSFQIAGDHTDDTQAYLTHGVPVYDGYFRVDVSGTLQNGVSPIFLAPLTREEATYSGPPASTPPASTPPASTSPASTPPASTSPASTPPSTTPPSTTGGQGSSTRTEVIRTLSGYMDAINDGDYDRAMSWVSDEIRAETTREQWNDDFATTYDDQLDVRRVRGSGDLVRAWAEFRSQQAAGYGPEGAEDATCLLWSIDYELTLQGERFVISDASGHTDPPWTRCD